jgi:hypothetical protein
MSKKLDSRQKHAGMTVGVRGNVPSQGMSPTVDV